MEQAGLFLQLGVFLLLVRASALAEVGLPVGEDGALVLADVQLPFPAEADAEREAGMLGAGQEEGVDLAVIGWEGVLLDLAGGAVVEDPDDGRRAALVVQQRGELVGGVGPQRDAVVHGWVVEVAAVVADQIAGGVGG